MKIFPLEVPVPRRHQYLLGCISPRPIAFASTMDKQGNPNVSPFSFFNCIGSNPPIVVFSPARSGRDNTTKNTLDNVEETREVVINIVNYAMVQQMSLASAPYPKGVNEFEKTGLTPIPSELVKPYRVKESPAQLECKVLDIIKTGTEGSAGNIVICEVVCMHIDDRVLDEEGKVSPYLFDQVARMGGDYYCRVIPESIFKLPQPKDTSGIGVDALPAAIRNSTILTGNDLGKLGVMTAIPRIDEAEPYLQEANGLTVEELHKRAHSMLEEGKVYEAFCLLMVKD
ncbi:MAG: flavin reductase family protein [Chitinophagales bacterium]